MCTVTLEYKNTALARRKLAALLATGLFAQKAMEKNPPVDEETAAEREEIRAFFEGSKRSMAEMITRSV